jgi:hypothetical protein
VNNHNRLKYFLTNKMFLLEVMYRHVRMIFIVKCVTITRNVLLCVIYQLNIAVFMYVTPISGYIALYKTFGVINGLF